VSRWLLFVVIGSLVSGGLLAAGILLFGRFGEIEEKIVGTTLFLGAFSFLGLASSLRIRRRRLVWLGVVGMAAAAAGFVLSTSGMWAEIDSEAFGKAMMSSMLIAGASASASVLMVVRPAAPQVRWVLTATLGLLVVVVGMGEFLVLWAPEDVSEGDVFLRILGAAAILTALGAIITPILNWVLRRRPA
jgi:hypothetical protein